MTSYNQRLFLEACLDSILAQGYPNLEVVVADDGSTDGTPDLLREYERRFPGTVVAILANENRGVTETCNRAYRACSGAYIAWINGDDLMLPGRVERQVAFLESHPDHAACAHEMDVLDSRSGRVVGRYSAAYPRDFHRRHDLAALVEYGFAGFSSMMTRKEACPAHGFDPRAGLTSDWLFWIETLTAGKWGYLPEVLGQWRVHETNSSRTRDHLPDTLATLQIVGERYPSLAGSVRRSRARVLYQRGVEETLNGRGRAARAWLWRSLHEGWVSWKWVGWMIRSMRPPDAALPPRRRGPEAACGEYPKMKERRYTSLYICYQSLLDPLTRAQVVAYLEGLAGAGYGIVLLTFEPKKINGSEARRLTDDLARRGIIWYSRRYHRRPSLPATIWDIAMGIGLGMVLIRRHSVSVVHARAHVPGVMALVLRRVTGTQLLFDMRGLKAEEQVDAGAWRADGLLFRAMKGTERRILRAADGVVVLTERVRMLLDAWYPAELTQTPMMVIPCCVDLRSIPEGEETAGSHHPPAFAYVGKLGGWYMTTEMIVCFAAARARIPDLRWHVWTQSDTESFRAELRARGLTQHVDTGVLPPEELLEALSGCDAGFCLVRPSVAKLASSPTKVGEYLASGLPVLSTAGVGDLDDLLTAGSCDDPRPVGALIRDFSERGVTEAIDQLTELVRDPDTPRRCRNVARERLDLCSVGWARYRELYALILGARPDESASRPDIQGTFSRV